jgi:hypothetical protein
VVAPGAVLALVLAAVFAPVQQAADRSGGGIRA